MPAKRDDDGTELPAPDPTMQRLLEALEAIAKRPQESVASEDRALMIAAIERMTETNLKGAQLIAQETRRAARPSNEVVPMRSAFNPRGNLVENWQKPTLICRMFLPWEAEDASLTREEVELLNLLVSCGSDEYIINRHDDTKIRIHVGVEMDLNKTKPTRMLINHETAFNNEYFRDMPSLRNYLRQMLAQVEDVDVQRATRHILTAEEEAALIRSGELAVSV